MSPPTCTRKWQVEAARDGRLRGKELEAAERHRVTCAECAKEARELEALAGSIARLPNFEPNSLVVRRARQRLLSALNESLLNGPPRRLPRAAFVGLAAALALAAAAALWFGL